MKKDKIQMLYTFANQLNIEYETRKLSKLFPPTYGMMFKVWVKLTRLTWLIHKLFLPSNLNLDKIFDLTDELGWVNMEKKIISDFPPCGKTVIFVTEFVVFLKTSK